jgi:hypothetical protein
MMPLCRLPGIVRFTLGTTLLVSLGAAAPARAQDAPASRLAQGEPASPAALAAQVRELRQALDAMQAQIVEARREADALRLKLQALDAQLAALKGDNARIDAVSQEQDLLDAKVEEHEQTKVASGSRYRVRLSGLVLVNVLGTHGSVDNLDLPLVAESRAAGLSNGAFSASVRQSFLNVEVFGARIAGANTVGDLSLDFFGGFPITAEGVTAPLVRLRTARVSLDWQHATLVAGQDVPFFSPRSPTSLASTAYPALSSAGNLWVWTPQVRLERRVALNERSTFSAQVGILDPLTGEPPAQEYNRIATAGERTGVPAAAVRAGFQRAAGERTIDLGAATYYARQSWIAGSTIPSWAVAGDWDVPLGAWFAVSGEVYRGEALGGFGGGASVPVLFDGPPATLRHVVPVRASGGWVQLKATPRPRLELNGAFGVDSPSRGRLLQLVPVTILAPASVNRNASAFVNTIFQARSNFVISVEYRRLWTTGLDDVMHRAHHVTFSTGIGF